jgi:SagB-type dehydrogenase family enzyme
VLHNASHVMTAKELRSPRDHQIHYAATNVELTRKEPSPRHGAIQLPLPEGLDLDLPPIWSARAEPCERVDLPLLSTLLRFAAGYQPIGDGRRRIAPSGGGLASTDLFLVVRRLEGLEPGVYHYFGWGHQLERIGVVPDALLAGALGTLETELPPLLVVGTSDMRKTRQKYDEFSFRIGVLDSGASRQFLQDIADSAGIPTTEYPDVRDPVMAHLLHLPTAGNRHMQTFALGLGAVRIDGERPDGLFHHYQSPDALIAMCARLGPTLVRDPAPLPTPHVAPHRVKSLGELMLGRRSQRRFSERPLPGSVIQSLAALADDAAKRRDRASGLAFEMNFWAVVLRSTDLEAGAYRWDPATRALRLHRRGANRDDILTTMQQHGYAEAPVTCFVTADFGDALTRYGPRGYREIGSRAGSMLARAQVAALGWDAVGSMWGGIADEGVGRFLGIDRYTDCPLFAASFGYAADD